MIRKIFILALGLVALFAAPAAAQYGTTTTPSVPGNTGTTQPAETTTTTAPETTTTTSTTTVECDVNLVDDAYTVTVNTPFVLGDPGVTENDEICPLPQTVQATSQTAHGTITNFDGGNGGFTYTPDAGFVGQDSYTYTVVETAKRGGRAIIRGEATVILTIGSVGSVGGNDDNQGGGGQSGGSLVRTGSNTDTLVKIGGMLLVAGGAVTLVASKRRRATA